MSRRKQLLIAGSLIAVAILIWCFFASRRISDERVADFTFSQEKQIAIPSTSRAQEKSRREVINGILSVLGTPITFYGKVVDQHGYPVPNATVNYTALDKFDTSGSQYQGKSDTEGNFSVTNIGGAALEVGVRKEGYYPIYGKSNSSFAYGMEADSERKEPPTKANPAVFVLQKMGATEPLIQVGGGQIDVSKTGIPLNVDFATGRGGQGNLQIESWIDDSAQPRFDWRYRLSVPGGGIVERKGQFNFEAPSDGYQPSVEVNMPADTEQWSSDVLKEYFAKLPDGRYARFSIEFYAGDRNFVVFKSYLNPKIGSRNLEFDPKR